MNRAGVLQSSKRPAEDSVLGQGRMGDLVQAVGTFQFPFAETGRKEIAAWELGLLLEGIDLSKGQRRKRYSLPTGRPESSATIGPQAEPETS